MPFPSARRRPAMGLVLLFAGWLWPAPAANARVWHVDDDAADQPAADFATIQAGIDAAAEGDTLVVHPGRYFEVLRLADKNLHIRGADPTSPAIVEATQIDAQLVDSVVVFSGRVGPATILEGLTLLNGSAQDGGGLRSAGDRPTSPTIRNNIIRLNFAIDRGGGIFRCDGLIERNRIESNEADRGGAIQGCAGVVRANTLSDNVARLGGAAAECPAAFESNVLRRNEARLQAGALYRCSGPIRDNAFVANSSAEDGGALHSCHGLIENNRFLHNLARQGGAIFGCNGTIRGNHVEKNRGNLGAGVMQCHGLIEHNLLVANVALQMGGGLAVCGGTIRLNLIEGNVALAAGGGLAQTTAVVEFNQISDNHAPRGAGLARCSGKVRRNRIERNYAEQAGGAIEESFLELDSNLIRGNGAPRGGALYACGGTVQNNTFVANWCDDGQAVIDIATRPMMFRNNIVAFANGAALRIPAGEPIALVSRHNLFHEIAGLLLLTPDGAAHLQPEQLDQLHDWSDGNRTGDPRFVDAGGKDGDPALGDDDDFRLTLDSPAIDAGLPDVLLNLPALDLSGAARLAGDAVDLGAYEWGAAPDSDGDGLDDDRELALGADPTRIDSDGDGADDSFEWLRGTPPGVAGTPVGLEVAPGDGVQLAIAMAYEGERIRIAPGVYYETLDSQGKNLHLTGWDPGSAQTRDATVIDATGRGPVLKLAGTEDRRFILAGLTLRRGYAVQHSGIDGRGASPVLRNLAVRDCRTTGGATVAQCTGPIVDCEFSGNQAVIGAALWQCHGEIRGNQFIGNRAVDGGALANCNGPIEDNLFDANHAIDEGGALYVCNGPVVRGNRFIRNQALFGGAIYRGSSRVIENEFIANIGRRGGGAIQFVSGVISDNYCEDNFANFGAAFSTCNGEIRRNTFTNNRAHVQGGALYSCSGEIKQNQMDGNSAYQGGALYSCSGEIAFNSLRRNEAVREGGALYGCSGRIRGNRIEDNLAQYGGAIWFSSAIFENNDVIGNVATRQAGGIGDSTGVFRRNVVMNNSSEEAGAFLRFDGDIQHNVIRGNSAVREGGALRDCRGRVMNNLIEGNRAWRGGAMQGCSADVINNTFIGNQAIPGPAGEPVQGGALHNASGRIINNIFQANGHIALYSGDPDPPRPGEQTPAPVVPRELRRNLFFAHYEAIYGTLAGLRVTSASSLDDVLPHSRENWEGDPLLEDADGPDGDPATFADNRPWLAPGSPAIDAGDDGVNPAGADLAGGPRYHAALAAESVIDLGAYEFFGVVISAHGSFADLRPGSSFTVEWLCSPAAGSAVRLELLRFGAVIAELGTDWSPLGRHAVTLRIPKDLPAGEGYQLRVSSLWNPVYEDTVPRDGFALKAERNAAADWRQYY
ncbi:MAG TPA: choice-of-anchor Q domain-containing protein [Candidatus Sumerlaeota bacterium]|nr:choice-of-anchor Q domain-containing protein [Candidatus Sumerlaeota bacterium]